MVRLTIPNLKVGSTMSGTPDPIWNVGTEVVDLIAAPTAEAAQAIMTARLRKAGIEELDGSEKRTAFLSEPLDPNLEIVIRREARS